MADTDMPRSMRGWRKTPSWWARLREPKEVTLGFAGAYLSIMVAGLSVVFIGPPLTIVGETSESVTTVWAAFHIFGGGIGAAFVWTRYWWIERIGAWLAGSGALVYLIIVGSLIFTAPTGNRVVQACYVLIALVMIAVRMYRIRGPLIEPGR